MLQKVGMLWLGLICAPIWADCPAEVEPVVSQQQESNWREEIMESKQVTKGTLTIVGLPLRTELARAADEIAPLWQRFEAEGWADRIPNRIDNRLYGLYTDYAGDYTQPYTLIVGVAVSKVEALPTELTTHEFVTGNYASYDIRGPLPQAIFEAWMAVWQSPLERAYQTDLEIYSDKGAELLIGVEGNDS